MRTDLVVFLGLVVAGSVLLQASARMDQQPQLVAPVILVELRCEASKPDTTALAVTLQNPATADTAVVLGVTLANGRLYLPIGIKVRVQRSAQMREDEMLYNNPTRGGRVDSWIVPLPAGSSFTFLVPVRHFISSTAYTTDFKRFIPGGEGLDVRVLLDARPIQFGNADVKLQAVWVGALTSNQIHVPNHCIEPSRG
jgi:hypothetical protein